MSHHVRGFESPPINPDFQGINFNPSIERIKNEEKFDSDPIVKSEKKQPGYDPNVDITRIKNYLNNLGAAKGDLATTRAMESLQKGTTQILNASFQKATDDDVNRMINIWVEQTFMEVYPNRPIPRENSDIFQRLKTHLLKVAYNPVRLSEDVPSRYAPTDVRRKYPIEDKLLKTANSIAEINIDDSNFYIEEHVGVFVTPEKQIGEFINELSRLTNVNYANLYLQNQNVKNNLNNAWFQINQDIKQNEANRSVTGGSFIKGTVKMAVAAIENKNGSGWILTQFTDQPQSKMQFQLNQELASYGEDYIERLFKDPAGELEKYLPSNATLKANYGQWAVTAKNEFIGNFQDQINQREIANLEQMTQEGEGFLSPEQISQQNHQLIKNLAPQWEGKLKGAEQKNNRILESQERDKLKSQFDNFNKSKTQVNSWFNAEGIVVNDSFKNAVASLLVGVDPDTDLLSAHDVVNSAMLEIDPNVVRKQADMSIINKLTPNTANYTEATEARQRQGYAYTPLGELKAYSASRTNPATGERIQESGDELMRNLHLYPELVQRTILYGINRPQTEITSYQKIGATGLPSGLFEGIEDQSPYFSAPPAPGGTFTFSPNYIEKPKQTELFNFQQIALDKINAEQAQQQANIEQANIDLNQIKIPNLTPNSMGEGY
tara:strand:+ start:659 stop:2650 length:1992 start_codon:yes stop_codon:yes gene_type:complete